jgi:hypothetical protein
MEWWRDGVMEGGREGWREAFGREGMDLPFYSKRGLGAYCRAKVERELVSLQPCFGVLDESRCRLLSERQSEGRVKTTRHGSNGPAMGSNGMARYAYPAR